MKKVYKKDLVELVQPYIDTIISKPTLNKVIDRTFKSILLETAKGNTVIIRDFGTFKKVSKTGYTPLSGEYDVDLIRFRMSPKVKKRINTLKEERNGSK